MDEAELETKLILLGIAVHQYSPTQWAAIEAGVDPREARFAFNKRRYRTFFDTKLAAMRVALRAALDGEERMEPYSD